MLKNSLRKKTSFYALTMASFTTLFHLAIFTKLLKRKTARKMSVILLLLISLVYQLKIVFGN